MSHNLGFDRTGLDMPLVQRGLPARWEALCILRIKLCKEGERAYGLHGLPAVWIQMGSFGVRRRLYTSVCRERSEPRAHAGTPEASPPPQNAALWEILPPKRSVVKSHTFKNSRRSVFITWLFLSRLGLLSFLSSLLRADERLKIKHVLGLREGSVSGPAR